VDDVGGPDLEEDQEIEFDVAQASRGPCATNVVRQCTATPTISPSHDDGDTTFTRRGLGRY